MPYFVFCGECPEGLMQSAPDGGTACDRCGRVVEPVPVPRVCGCGHRLAIHEYPGMCRGAVLYPDDQVRCECHRDHPYEVIAADRERLAAEDAGMTVPS